MFTLELNEKEVKALGERRWTRKHWKKLLLANIGTFLLWAIPAITLGEMEVSTILHLSISIPLVIIFATTYAFSAHRIGKNGEAFLKEQIKEAK